MKCEWEGLAEVNGVNRALGLSECDFARMPPIDRAAERAMQDATVAAADVQKLAATPTGEYSSSSAVRGTASAIRESTPLGAQQHGINPGGVAHAPSQAVVPAIPSPPVATPTLTPQHHIRSYSGGSGASSTQASSVSPVRGAIKEAAESLRSLPSPRVVVMNSPVPITKTHQPSTSKPLEEAQNLFASDATKTQKTARGASVQEQNHNLNARNVGLIIGHRLEAAAKIAARNEITQATAQPQPATISCEQKLSAKIGEGVKQPNGVQLARGTPTANLVKVTMPVGRRLSQSESQEVSARIQTAHAVKERQPVPALNRHSDFSILISEQRYAQTTSSSQQSQQVSPILSSRASAAIEGSTMAATAVDRVPSETATWQLSERAEAREVERTYIPTAQPACSVPANFVLEGDRERVSTSNSTSMLAMKGSELFQAGSEAVSNPRAPVVHPGVHDQQAGQVATWFERILPASHLHIPPHLEQVGQHRAEVAPSAQRQRLLDRQRQHQRRFLAQLLRVMGVQSDPQFIELLRLLEQNLRTTRRPLPLSAFALLLSSLTLGREEKERLLRSLGLSSEEIVIALQTVVPVPALNASPGAPQPRLQTW